ncbi:hypothetical protein LDENG_00150870, partial [Lucifuga dentata]
VNIPSLFFCIIRNNYKFRNLCLCPSICLSVCGTNISRTWHYMKLKFGRFIAQDPRTCSVMCEVVWMSGSRIELCWKK